MRFVSRRTPRYMTATFVAALQKHTQHAQAAKDRETLLLCGDIPADINVACMPTYK